MKKPFLVSTLAALLIITGYFATRPAPRIAPASAPVKARAPERNVEPSAPAVAEPVAPPPLAGAEIPPPASEDLQPPDLKKMAAFTNWTQRWSVAAPGEREALREEGRSLATARRPEFKRLIKAEPRQALEMSVPRVVRQTLPAEIVAQLEQPVSARGDLHVYFGKPEPGVVVPEGTELTARYFETKDEKNYKARVFGKLEHLTSRKDIPLRGVALDRELAVAESPVRQLENGEIIEPGTIVEQTCPVSNITTPGDPNQPVTDEAPAIEVEGRVIRLCNGTHVRVLDEKYTDGIMASGPGGAGFFRDAYPGTAAEKRSCQSDKATSICNYCERSVIPAGAGLWAFSITRPKMRRPGCAQTSKGWIGSSRNSNSAEEEED